MLHRRGAPLAAVVAAVALFATVACAAPLATPVRDDVSWDYFLLVVRWAGSGCLTQPSGCAVPSSAADWNLHGIWPNRNNTQWPSFCDDADKFDLNALGSSLVSQMNVYWTNFDDPTSGSDFWSHEWDKHGTCAKTDPLTSNQHDYFAAAVKLVQRLNIGATLSAAGIGGGSSVSVATVTNTLSAAGTPGMVFCYKSSQYNVPVLETLQFCVDKNLNVFQCDATMLKKRDETCDCSDQTFLPPVQHSGAAAKAQQVRAF